MCRARAVSYTHLDVYKRQLVIIAVISMFYTAFRDNVFVGMAMNGMLAAVAAVICDVVLSMGRTVLQDRKLLYAGLMAGCFLASEWFQVNILLLLVVCGADVYKRQGGRSAGRSRCILYK